jgi:hypothetical protein
VKKESAKLHHQVFHLISEVIKEDMGHYLCWGHIHYDFESLAPHCMLKHMVIADFHHGQALGVSTLDILPKNSPLKFLFPRIFKISLQCHH